LIETINRPAIAGIPGRSGTRPTGGRIGDSAHVLVERRTHRQPPPGLEY
jgi:hypothetical protein